jgi:hypothetical protein
MGTKDVCHYRENYLASLYLILSLVFQLFLNLMWSFWFTPIENTILTWNLLILLLSMLLVDLIICLLSCIWNLCMLTLLSWICMVRTMHSPIIRGRCFLRTIGAITDAEQGNVKFNIPHKKCMKHFPRKKEGKNNFPHGMLHLLKTWGIESSYIITNKELYGRQPGCFSIFLVFCSFLVCVFILFLDFVFIKVLSLSHLDLKDDLVLRVVVIYAVLFTRKIIEKFNYFIKDFNKDDLVKNWVISVGKVL